MISPLGQFNFRLPQSLGSVRPVDFEKPCDQMLVLELFAGTATLSSELRKAGFQILAVDKSSGRNPFVELVERAVANSPYRQCGVFPWSPAMRDCVPSSR